MIEVASHAFLLPTYAACCHAPCNFPAVEIKEKEPEYFGDAFQNVKGSYSATNHYELCPKLTEKKEP